MAEASDIALVLHTSGTTSRPKIVPLSQTNITASAYHIGNSLALRENDTCLNIMPLFHIHGLIAATLSSIAAGASVICTPGFNALKFFSWMEETRPTWYTAVPTMHQAILTRADRNKEIIAQGRLRLIRSSSSSLPPQVMEALEATFGVPVIEAYGMTEAAHQMASNPLPPGKRFSGCVGIAAGPDVAIMDEVGVLLGSGELGEIVIRGRNVTAGYEANVEANAKAFTNGWFRTGDQGTIDADGYLRLTGRLKELINRGGEKISPLEVDTVIMDHPAVAQVVTFGVPHDKLGEDVAAAVVLREGAACDARELRAFVGSRIADFKVPRKIVFLDEIPKGATGKLQRIGLHEKLAAELGMVG
jgi:acyl-CoA synthetase (AMP-forming)/AMP-acid ligase II